MLEKLKNTYKLWHNCHRELPKTQKYSLGNRIDKLFIESIEATATAAFLPKTEKTSWVRAAIRKTDTIKILIAILWETKAIDDKKYIALSETLNEIGKMLGGWNGQLTKFLDSARDKQNSPATKAREK